MSEDVIIRKKSFLFTFTIPVFFILFLILTSGCLDNNKISERDAVSIALNNSQIHHLINNNEFKITDIGSGIITSGDGKREEVYEVTIRVQNSSTERIIVFVNYYGEIVMVDSPYTAKVPDSLIHRINGTPVQGSM